MTALAATPIASRAANASAGRRVLSGLVAACLVALLAGGVYWAYAALAPTPSQIALARYFPASTVAYAAVDMQAAQSGQGSGTQSLFSGSLGTGVLGSTGLNWATDVQPWAGPMVGLGIYATSGSATAGGSDSLTSLAGIGETVVLQSHDDGAANTAVQKALMHEQESGSAFSKSSYGGFTVYTPTSGAAEALATGHGVVLLASSLAAAQTAIDRANGSGNTLAGDSTFLQAVGGLPSGRFGTLYFDVKSVTDPTGLGATPIKLPFVDTYPVGVGWLGWTAAGMRWQLSMAPAQRGLPSTNISGDTSSLASLVPADAASYFGVANLGGLSRSLNVLLSGGQPARGSLDLLPGAVGIPTSAAGADVPAATFTEPNPATSSTIPVDSATLLREPTAADAAALMATIAAAQHWSQQSGIVGGVPATSYFGTDTAPDDTASILGASSPSALRVVEADVDGVMVMATSAQGFEHVVAVMQGHAPSLGQLAGFRQLVATAPANAAATVYGSSSALGSLLVGLPALASPTPALGSSALVTLSWTPANLALTYDTVTR